MSILRAFCALRYQNRIVIHFSVQSREDVIFAKDLESIAANFSETVQLRLCFTRAADSAAAGASASSANAIISHGRITKSGLEEVCKASALSSANQSSVFLWYEHTCSTILQFLYQGTFFWCSGPETYIQEADKFLKEIYQGKTYLLFTERYY